MNLDAIVKFLGTAHGAVAAITGIATVIMSPVLSVRSALLARPGRR